MNDQRKDNEERGSLLFKYTMKQAGCQGDEMCCSVRSSVNGLKVTKK